MDLLFTHALLVLIEPLFTTELVSLRKCHYLSSQKCPCTPRTLRFLHLDPDIFLEHYEFFLQTLISQHKLI